jgi:16S rRNA (adenine1518-N6/adenine1519-N6)-dimethyltransferase
MSLLRKIVRVALPLEGCDVVEIGPGPGGLTLAISEFIGDGKIFAIEKDASLATLHERLLGAVGSNLEFVYADALRVNPSDFTDNDVTIIANLPYNIGTRLLVNWLLNLGRIKKLVLLFQQEVAERICAHPGTKRYGALSVLSQVVCHVEKVFDVSNKAFYPSPKVMSSVVKLTPMATLPDATSLAGLQKLVFRLFQSRRKTMYNSLRKHCEQNDIDAVLLACEIEKTARPETLPPEVFVKLSRLLQ